MATSKNGETATATAKRNQIPKRIRKHLNEAFGSLTHNASGDGEIEQVDAARKEVLAYINGLLKQLPA